MLMNSKTGIALSVIAIGSSNSCVCSNSLCSSSPGTSFRLPRRLPQRLRLWLPQRLRLWLPQRLRRLRRLRRRLWRLRRAAVAASDRDKSTNVEGHKYPLLFCHLVFDLYSDPNMTFQGTALKPKSTIP